MSQKITGTNDLLIFPGRSYGPEGPKKFEKMPSSRYRYEALDSQLCLVSEIASDFWGLRWASQLQKSLRFRCTKVCMKLSPSGIELFKREWKFLASNPPMPFFGGEFWRWRLNFQASLKFSRATENFQRVLSGTPVREFQSRSDSRYTFAIVYRLMLFLYRRVSRYTPQATLSWGHRKDYVGSTRAIKDQLEIANVVPPSSQSLAVKEFCFMARGICRGFFVKFLAPTFPGNWRTKIGEKFASFSPHFSPTSAKNFARISLSGLFGVTNAGVSGRRVSQ